jgi:hypothetical protein
MHQGICAGFAMLVTLRVFAHHSGALFEAQKTKTLSGTVRAFQWTNPHCWIQIVVPGQGDPIEWSVELGSPSQLYNLGWKPRTLKPGDKIVVVVHPTRDGTNGGIFVSATDGEGKPLVVARNGEAGG